MSEEKGAIQQYCSEVWFWVLLRGVALMILGGLLIAKQGVTAMVLVQFLGAYFLVDGIFVIVNSITGRKYVQGWGWGLVMGALEIITAIFIFSNPLIATLVTGKVLAYCVAFMAIAFGLFGIMTGFQVRKEVEGEWAMIISGLLAIIFGVILIIKPLESASIYLLIMGIAALIGGLIQIIASFRIRQVGKKGIAALD